MKRNKERAADQVQTSIAIPETLMQALDRIKVHEGRSRNNLITKLLADAVKEYEENEEGKQIPPLDLARGSQSGDVRGAGRKTKGAKAK